MPNGQAALRWSAHNGRQLNLGILPPQLPPGTRWGWHRWLELPDCLGPQEQMLQELAPIRPGMLGHVRKPFIRVISPRTRPTPKGNRAGKVLASRAEVYKTSRNVTPDNNVSADF